MAFIKRVIIQNFKSIERIDLQLNQDLNIIVGNNEVGKSTILEAIDMALSGRINGKSISSELSPFFFNQNVTRNYIEKLQEGNLVIPKILVELYLIQTPEITFLKGNNNSIREDACGMFVSIEFDDDFAEEYQSYITDTESIKTIPIEYFKVVWQSFAHNSITKRSLPISSTFIDATTIRLQYGTDYYIRKVIEENLTPKERAQLSLDYRNLRELFADKEYLMGIKQVVEENQQLLQDKHLSISLDISGKANWESTMTTYLDDIPYLFIGKGTQNVLKILLSIEKEGTDSNIVIIEEPENHLSYSNMSRLISMIIARCEGKQLIITTHSTYVLNKLGMDKTILIGDNKQPSSFMNLPPDTIDFFMKFPGYDTLRMLLCKRAILVEGPSDELIVQKAYLLVNNKLPIDDGIDVITVRGLSFKRFLDLSLQLSKPVSVVTDNDGDYQTNIVAKYEAYSGIEHIKICYDTNNELKTLEYHMAAVNELTTINSILNRDFSEKSDLIDYMLKNKTEAALKIFEANVPIEIPIYISDAITNE